MSARNRCRPTDSCGRVLSQIRRDDRRFGPTHRNLRSHLRTRSGETDRREFASRRSLRRSHRPTRRTVFIQPPFLRWFEWPGCPYFAKAVTDFSLQMSVGPRKPVSGFTPASTWRRSEAALRTQQEPRPPFLRQHLSPGLTRGCCQPDLPMA